MWYCSFYNPGEKKERRGVDSYWESVTPAWDLVRALIKKKKGGTEMSGRISDGVGVSEA